ncbi:hypothetical protein HPP92_004003, partial [Vanilla planifolia]
MWEKKKKNQAEKPGPPIKYSCGSQLSHVLRQSCDTTSFALRSFTPVWLSIILNSTVNGWNGVAGQPVVYSLEAIQRRGCCLYNPHSLQARRPTREEELVSLAWRLCIYDASVQLLRQTRHLEQVAQVHNTCHHTPSFSAGDGLQDYISAVLWVDGWTAYLISVLYVSTELGRRGESGLPIHVIQWFEGPRWAPGNWAVVSSFTFLSSRFSNTAHCLRQ